MAMRHYSHEAGRPTVRVPPRVQTSVFRPSRRPGCPARPQSRPSAGRSLLPGRQRGGVHRTGAGQAEIGRASWREGVWQDVEIWVVALTLKKKKQKNKQN